MVNQIFTFDVMIYVSPWSDLKGSLCLKQNQTICLWREDMQWQHGICACETAFLQPLLSVERKTLRVEKKWPQHPCSSNHLIVTRPKAMRFSTPVCKTVPRVTSSTFIDNDYCLPDAFSVLHRIVNYNYILSDIFWLTDVTSSQCITFLTIIIVYCCFVFLVSLMLIKFRCEYRLLFVCVLYMWHNIVKMITIVLCVTWHST